jgi:hypothetical protein
MLYSKNGSYPKPETDGTDGWIEVSEPPFAGDGIEVVWWYPPGWVARPIKPADEEGFVWKWSQSEAQWNKHQIEPGEITLEAGSAGIILDGATAGISLTAGTATSV